MTEVRIYKGSVLVDPECWVVDATGDVEAEARLIAAAPDLLAALEAAVNRGYMWDNDPDLWSAASNAVRRAKGD